MLSQLSASLSHYSPSPLSSITALYLRPLLTPFSSKPPPSLLSSTSKSLRKFRFYPSSPHKSQPRPPSLVSNSYRGLSMDSPSMNTDLSVDSVADDLKKQSLGEDRVKLNLEDLNWDHSFVRDLPGDPRTDKMPREVLHACYTKVSPSAEVENPQLVAWSDSVAELLCLDPNEFKRPDFPLIFSGASPLVGGMPYAQCYGGHQFGMWAGQLGDGRAITLGEILNSKSERWDLQLKGAGKTPYSRFADGLAVLRSSIREFLCSEAMHSLGIPTTRALCLVMTGKYVTRDMFYDGNPKDEPGAIVCRVAQSFLRFGSYQIHASRGKEDLDIVRTLADYTIRHHFPRIENTSKSESLSFNTSEEDSSVVDLTSNKGWALVQR
uniref:Selenoprotein O n=1 Tax=Davidia involucrata TaxID=16924 RepID=A0A5B6ZZ45_DAVIN